MEENREKEFTIDVERKIGEWRKLYNTQTSRACLVVAILVLATMLVFVPVKHWGVFFFAAICGGIGAGVISASVLATVFLVKPKVRREMKTALDGAQTDKQRERMRAAFGITRIKEPGFGGMLLNCLSKASQLNHQANSGSG